MRYRVIFVLLFASTCICVAVAYSSQQSIDVPGQTADLGVSRDALFLTALMGFASTIMLQVFKILDDRRKRKWDMEDRALARKAQKNDTIQAAIELAKLSQKTRDALFRAIDDNTIATVEGTRAALAAYEHANSANEKIAKLERDLTAKEVTINDIAAVGEDTNVKVTDLKTAVEEAAKKDE